MAQRFDQHRPDSPDELPGSLVEGLGRIYGRDVPVSPQIDQAILADAAQRLNKVMRFRRLLRWGAAAGTAAAAAVVLLLLRFGGPDPARPQVAGTVPPAVSQPTMLDAYRLARQLDAGEQPEARFDRDGNGRVDRADVEALARAAVSISGGPVQ